ncbi:hypothetical protein ACHAWO_008669 [Cyclotella atomus]|uniref:Uncharacterized protein n=1 Tax=Cyclotella atomus TaxID=382360 RepID=A0ABD3N772_9STRA
MNFSHRQPRRPPRSLSNERKRRRHRSSSSSSRKSTDRRKLEKHTADRSNQKLMDQYEVLCELQRRFDSSVDKLGSRVDKMSSRRLATRRSNERNAWTYLVVSTCVILASMATTDDVSILPSAYDGRQNKSLYWTALSICIVQLMLCLYKSISLIRDQWSGNATGRRQPATAVVTLGTALLALTFQATINAILLGRSNHFALSGLSISNHNMFYGCWISFTLISYLLGNAVSSMLYKTTSSLVKRFRSNSRNRERRLELGKVMTTLWTMHLLFQIGVLSTTLSVQVGPICGGMLRTTKSCRGVSTAVILGIFNLPICLVCIFNIFAFLRLTDATAVKLYGLCAALSVVIQAVTTSLLTTMGMLGSNPGNLFLSTWINTVISLVIGLKCIDGYWAVDIPLAKEVADEERVDSTVIAYPSKVGRSSVSIVRSRRSSRTIETPSTDVSEDEDEFIVNKPLPQQQAKQRSRSTDAGTSAQCSSRAPAHLLALPAPPPPTEAHLEPSRSQRMAPRPPPPPRSLPSQEPPEKPARDPVPPSSSARARSQRSTVRTPNYSIAPQPPPFRDPTTAAKKSPRQTFNVSDGRKVFMEPISEDENRRSTNWDPPASNPGSIQDAAYYHSSRDITIPSSDSDDAFLTNGGHRIASRGRANVGVSNSNSDSIFDQRRRSPRKSRTGKDPSLIHPSVNSIGNEVTSTPNTNRTSRKSKSPAATRKSARPTRSTKAASPKWDRRERSLSSESSAFMRSERRTALKASQKESSTTIGESWIPGHSDSEASSVFNRHPDMSSKQSSKKSLKSSTAAIGDEQSMRSVNVDRKTLIAMTSLDIDVSSSDDSAEKAVSATSRLSSFTKQSSTNAETPISMKNIDDYIAPLPNVNPNGLRAGLTRQLPRQSSGNTSETASFTKATFSREPSSRDVAKRSSFNQSAATKTFAPFTSNADHQTAVAAALIAAGSMPFPVKKELQESELSDHSPATNDDDDSGVETLSTDSDYNSFAKRASLQSFEFGASAVDEGSTQDQSSEKSRGLNRNFLDFEYRPRASIKNLDAEFSKRQILSSFFDNPFKDSAPMGSINVEDGSLVSEPTIDNSIRTAKISAAPQAEIDATVKAALEKARVAQRTSLLMSMKSIGKISVEGQGNVQDVNEIVAAALKAASDSRGPTRSFNATPPPTTSTSRHPRKKSLSSNFSNDIVNSVSKSVYGESYTESGSFAHC